jgi:hypothetical protein
MDRLGTRLSIDIADWGDKGQELAGHIILLGQALLPILKRMAPAPVYAASLLQPGVLRLLQQLALHPPPPPAAGAAAAASGSPLDALRPSALLDSLEEHIDLCGAVLEVQWREQMFNPHAQPGTPTTAGHTTISSSSSSSCPRPRMGPGPEQIAMVMGQEVRMQRHIPCCTCCMIEHGGDQLRLLHHSTEQFAS